MPTRLAALLAIFAICLAGCGGSSDAPGAVTVRGTIDGVDGQPAAGAAVVLLGEAAGVSATGCLAPTGAPPCSGSQRATTAADGTFSFSLRSGKGATYEVATGAAEGPSVSTVFQAAGRSLRLPALHLWAPKVDLTVTVNRTARTNWPSLGPGASDQVVYSHAGATTWIADGRPPLAVDTRVLEDDKGSAVVASTSTSDIDGGSFRITSRSAPTPYEGKAGAPPSRGLPCLPAPCWLTDGDLTTAGPAGGALHEATVDLTRSTAVSLIVVRGCPAACDVETSIDGLTYKIVGTGDQPFQIVTPPSGPDIRYVRVKSVSDLRSLTEVSVW